MNEKKSLSCRGGRCCALPVVALAVACFVSGVGAAGIASGPFYVDSLAPAGGDGLTWATAFTTVTEGVAEANLADTAEVWVKAGTYSPTASVSLGSGTGVYGGFNGTERRRDDRDWRNHPTTIDGGGQGFSIFTANGVMSFVLEGLILVGGGGSGDVDGGAVNVSSSQGEVRQCNFSGNVAQTTGSAGGNGGALFVSDSTLIVSECQFASNTATGGALAGGFGGAAAIVSGSNASFADCMFEYNSAVGGIDPDAGAYRAVGGADGGEGGALYVDVAGVTVVRTAFTSNSVTPGSNSGGKGGAIACHFATEMSLTNCTFVSNWANDYWNGGVLSVKGQGGALYDEASDAEVMNGTFYLNSAYNYRGGGIVADATDLLVTNTILWGNSAQADPQWVLVGPSTKTVTNCNVEGENYDGTVNGNISQNPQFGDTYSGDVHLQPGSPCINAGTTLGAPDEDIRMTPRPSSGGVDIGAYEWVRIIYVNANATGTQDGTSWESAYESPQTALQDAELGDEIWVAAGTYVPAYLPVRGVQDATFALVDGVALYGGFDGSEDAREERDWQNNETILSGVSQLGVATDDAYHVVTADNCGGRTRLDGFTITGGKATGAVSPADRGGGALLTNSSLTITHCTFTQNTALAAGGGAHVSGGAPFLGKCTFVGNTTSGTGGGLNASGTSLALDRCAFGKNSAGVAGGGSYHEGEGMGYVANCVYRENLGQNGGGAAVGGPDVAFVNTLFDSNDAETGGGLASVASSLTITNCTFAGNHAYDGGGLWGGYGGGALNVANTIMWGNTVEATGDQLGKSVDGPTTLFSNCDVSGSGGSASWDTALGTDGGGNVDADPMFVDAAGRDYALLPGSPCIDAALTNEAGYRDTDADGHARYDDPAAPNADVDSSEAPDIGAFEYSQIYIDIDGNDSSGTGRPDAPYATIQQGIDRAQRGGEVVILGGTYATPAVYAGAGNTDLTFRGKQITVRSGKPESPDLTVIDGGGEGRGVLFNAGETADSILQGITIRNGGHVYGGGIACEGGASPTIERCILDSNTAYTAEGSMGYGGGLYVAEGSPRLIDCEIKNNTAYMSGGGVYVEGGTDSYPTGLDNRSRGDVLKGGKVGTALDLSSCRITGNMAQGEGGGVYCSMASIKIVDTLISANQASGGAGMTLQGASGAQIRRSLFHLNAANQGDGGGLLSSFSDVDVSNTTFHENSADRGGAIMVSYGELSARSVTVTDNEAQTQGGGIMGTYSATVDLANAIVWGNLGPEGSVDELVLINDAAAIVQYTAITGSWSGMNNTGADPMLGPLTDNGGPTQTRMLPSGSPAIDAGTDGEAVGTQYDQRGPGFARFVDGNGDEAPTVDLGAVERVNLGSLGDQVWYDGNGNGLQDPGEFGEPGVTVRLLDGNGTAIPDMETTTDTQGMYIFADLKAGDYILEFDIPQDYLISPAEVGGDDVVDSDVDAATGRTAIISLATGQLLDTWDMGVIGTLDSDDDGMADSWEVANGLDLTVADAHLDPDLDGYENGAEFEGNGNPRDPVSLPFVRSGAGDALVFDGVDDYLDCGSDSSLVGMSVLTIEAWVKPSVADAHRVIVSNFGVSNASGGYQLSVTNAPCKFNFTFRGVDFTDRSLSGASDVRVDEWQHVAATMRWTGSATEVKLYVNGVLDGENTFGGQQISYTDVSPLYIGSNTDGAPPGVATLVREYHGALDEVRLWAAVLQPLQIQEWMNRKLTLEHTDHSLLIGYWRFDESSTGYAIDSSLRTNTGVPAGGLDLWSATQLSTAPVGDDSILVYGTESIYGNSSIPVALYQQTARGSAGVTALIQVKAHPENASGLPANYPPLYWEIWQAGHDGSASADLAFMLNNLAGIANELALALFRRTDAGQTWGEEAQAMVRAEGSPTDGAGSIILDGASNFGQFIIGSGSERNTFQSGTVWHVGAGSYRRGTPDGLSWGTAFTDLQDALVAAEPGDDIWVAAGRYAPGTTSANSFVLPPGVRLFGGFYGYEQSRHDRDPAMNETKLDGSVGPETNAYHVVTASEGSSIDGFHIVNGLAIGSTPDDRGAGLIADGVTAWVSNCVFAGNAAMNEGGGMFAQGDLQAVVNCRFFGNSAGSGGGMAVLDASPGIINAVFLYNAAAGPGGGAFLSTTSAQVMNCTFSANQAVEGGACYVTGSGTPEITNSILWGDDVAVNAQEIFNNDTQLRVTASDIQGGIDAATCGGTGCDDGGGNLDTDPRFLRQPEVDGGQRSPQPGLDSDDVRLTWQSPCVDSGVLPGSPGVDVTNRERPTDIAGHGADGGEALPDMGAYEARSAALMSLAPDSGILDFPPQHVGGGASAPLSVMVTNSGFVEMAITNTSIYGGDMLEFGHVSSPGPVTLQPGETHILEVTFDPAEAGPRTSELAVMTDAYDEGGGTGYALLKGTGDAPMDMITDGGLAANDEFGAAVCIDGNRLIVGAPGHDSADPVAPDQGIAHIYRFEDGAWVPEQTLISPSVDSELEFGASVAIEGDLAVVGMPNLNVDGHDRGAVHVFAWNGTIEEWEWQEQLSPPDAEYVDGVLFGGAVAIDNGRIVVGAPGNNAGGGGSNLNSGRVYVFEDSGQRGGRTASIIYNPQADPHDLFGTSVALDGDTLVVGAPHGGEHLSPAFGQAYVFSGGTGAWELVLELVPGTPALENGAQFGMSVAVGGDWIAVGAPFAAHLGADAGIVHTFRWENGMWKHDTALYGLDTTTGDDFGRAIDLQDGTLIVGAPGHRHGEVDDAGALYVFEVDGTATWQQRQRLERDSSYSDDSFATSLSLDWGRAAIGAQDDAGKGAVLVYSVDGPADGVIGDMVWEDTDGDGIQTLGELGLPFVTVQLLDVEDTTVLASTQTDSGGNYALSGLPMGDYRVRFAAPDGYRFSPTGGGATEVDSDPDPGTGVSDVVTLAAGNRSVDDVDAGLIPLLDFGDAPYDGEGAMFPTALAQNGAVHQIRSDFFLGERVDDEPDGAPSVLADGDDGIGDDDEDGVTFDDPLIPGLSARVAVSSTLIGPAPGILNAWIDFDRSGTWEDPGERVLTNTTLSNGPNSLMIPVPANAISGYTFARFRMSSQPSLTPDGAAPDGEVEDYRVLINLPPVPVLGGPYTVTEGDQISLNAGGSSDPDGTIVSYVWDLDGDEIFGEAGFDAANGSETGPTPTFAATALDGPFGQDIALRVTDTQGAMREVWGSITVNNAIPVVLSGTTGETITEGVPFEVQLASFTDAGASDTHTATIDWGDGTSPQSGTVSQPTPVVPGTVTGSHTYTQNGVYTVQTTLTDDDGGTDSDTLSITVENSAPVLVQPTGQAALVGETVSLAGVSFTDSGSEDTHTATIDWGDGVSGDTGTVTEPAGPTPGSVQGSHVYAAADIYTVTVTLSDGDGGSVQRSWQVTIRVPFEVTADTGLSTPAGEYTQFVLARFTNADNTSPHTATVTWGDGSDDTYTTLEPTPGSAGEVWGTHRYDSAGSYPVSITVTDDQESEETVSTSIEVLPLDYGDAPAGTSFPTLRDDDGARHVIVSGVALGALVDEDADGQPSSEALGDDADAGGNDDDGIAVVGVLRPGSPADVSVVVLAPIDTTVYLDAWIDFAHDASWDGDSDRIFDSLPLQAGNHTLQITVPETAVLGATTGRFRLSSTGGLGPSGLALDGEVEDHEILIGDLSEIRGTAWFDMNANGLWDGGEPSVAGLNLSLSDTGGFVGGASTGADGAYRFHTLQAGSYTVQASVPYGFKLTSNGVTRTQDSRFDPVTHMTPTIILGGKDVELGWDVGLVLDAVSAIETGGISARATAISADGSVTGFERWADGTIHPFRQLVNLRRSVTPADASIEGTATAIDEDGTIVGNLYGENGQTMAFTWDVVSDNPTEIAPGDTGTSSAWSIRDGLIAGSYEHTINGQSVEQACLWDEGVCLDLGTLGGSRSIAYAINASGIVVGKAENAAGVSVAFVAGDGQMVPVDGDDDRQSVAYAINDGGVIVGQKADEDGVLQAVRWQSSVPTFLAGLGGGRSCALAINAAGRIVGWAEGADGRTHAVMWNQRGSVLDLDRLLWDPWTEWELESATGINATGDVVGYGMISGSRQPFHFAVPSANIPAIVAAPSVVGTGTWGLVGEPLLLMLDAFDPDGDIVAVVFLAAGQEIPADVGTAPRSALATGSFTATVTGLPAGEHEVQVRITDSSGSTTTTPPATVAVYAERVPAQDDSYTTEEFATLTLAAPGVLSNDGVSVAQGLEIVTQPTKGDVVLSVDGGFVYVPIPELLDFEESGEDTDQFTYQVSATGYAPGEATVTIAITRSELVFNLELNSGWNLISVPLQPIETTVGDILDDAVAGPTWGWEDGGYVDAQTLVPGMGYWVYRDGASTTVPIHGYAIRNSARVLSPGWHLIGSGGTPGFEPVHPEWLARPEGNVTPRPYAWDGSDYDIDNELKCGVGYWLEIRQESDLSLGGIQLTPLME